MASNFITRALAKTIQEPYDFNAPLIINGIEIKPGERKIIDIPFGQLVSHDVAILRVHVIRGKRPGPRVLVTGGIHGDELNGIEIARQLVSSRRLSGLRGDVVVIPVVNLPAFLIRSRYLPDRRDLNRLFPGAEKGSLGARLLHTFLHEVALKCTHCIDLHTAADGRTNLPQVRICEKDKGALEMGKAFNAPVILPSPIRDGSLRAALTFYGISTVLYEGGEARYIDIPAVKFGLAGIISVLISLDILRERKSDLKRKHQSALCTESTWMRAPSGGLFRALVPLGKAVSQGDPIAAIGDPFSTQETRLVADCDGIVIGRTTQALVDEGDALFHIGLPSSSFHTRVEERITQAADHVLADSDPTPYYDPIGGQ